MKKAILTFLILSMASFASAQRQAFLKVEDGDPLVSVFNQDGVGENWKYCKKDSQGRCENAVGWLDKNAEITVLGEKVRHETIDPFTNQKIEEDYYPIRFRYIRNGEVKERDGYIEAAYLSFKKVQPLMSPPTKKTSPSECSLKSGGTTTAIENLKCKVDFQVLEDASEKIQNVIGVCANPKQDKDKSKSLYDSLILNSVKSSPPPQVVGESGEKITKGDLVSIDSLARTLYGEMASCYKHGLEYPMAVARIAVNRAENVKRAREFIKAPHESEKSNLSKVVTSGTQFNAWLRKLNDKANPSADMALCPARHSKQTLLSGRTPTKQELAVWQHSVRIATEAVLFPEFFKKRTQGLKDLYFYTSGMGQFYNMKKQSREIEGRAIRNDRCLELWAESEDPKKGRKVSFLFDPQ